MSLRGLRWGVPMAIALALLISGQVAAAGPTTYGEPPNDTYIPPRTTAEAAFESVKLDAAKRLETSGLSRQVGGLQPDSCGPDCPPTSLALSAYARQQAQSYYCGPASGQVAINLSWGIYNSNTGGTTTSNNKYTQATIASHMSTTTNGTSGANLAGGLNDLVLKPVPEWVYLYAASGDGSALHGKVVTDTWQYGMTLDLPVKPHDPGKMYYLTSWPSAITAWHWIGIRGYYKFWDGTRTPLFYYTDSAGGYGGSTGRYSDPSLDVWYTNSYNTGNVVW